MSIDKNGLKVMMVLKGNRYDAAMLLEAAKTAPVVFVDDNQLHDLDDRQYRPTFEAKGSKLSAAEVASRFEATAVLFHKHEGKYVVLTGSNAILTNRKGAHFADKPQHAGRMISGPLLKKTREELPETQAPIQTRRVYDDEFRNAPRIVSRPANVDARYPANHDDKKGSGFYASEGPRDSGFNRPRRELPSSDGKNTFFVLDVSVFLNDPQEALFKYKGGDVYIPVVVLSELRRLARLEKDGAAADAQDALMVLHRLMAASPTREQLRFPLDASGRDECSGYLYADRRAELPETSGPHDEVLIQAAIDLRSKHPGKRVVIISWDEAVRSKFRATGISAFESVDKYRGYLAYKQAGGAERGSVYHRVNQFTGRD